MVPSRNGSGGESGGERGEGDGWDISEEYLLTSSVGTVKRIVQKAVNSISKVGWIFWLGVTITLVLLFWCFVLLCFILLLSFCSKFFLAHFAYFSFVFLFLSLTWRNWSGSYIWRRLQQRSRSEAPLLSLGLADITSQRSSTYRFLYPQIKERFNIDYTRIERNHTRTTLQ